MKLFPFSTLFLFCQIHAHLLLYLLSSSVDWDFRNIASQDKAALGQVHPIAGYRRDLLARAFMGEILFVPPLRVKDRAVAYVLAPVRDQDLLCLASGPATSCVPAPPSV